MAKEKKNYEERINEAIERWNEMEISELLEEQRHLEEQRSFHMEELSLLKKLEKALKEILADREVSGYYGDDNPDDSLRPIHHF